MKTNKIVQIRKSVVFTTTLIIAENCDVTHEAVIKLTRRFLEDLNKVGRVRFEIRPFETAGGMQKQEIAELDDYAAMLLLTYMRNSEVVAKFKLDLITEFKRMREILTDPTRKSAIQQKRSAHNPMMDAVIFARENFGLNYPSQQVFANENLLCNFVLTGKWSAIDERELDAYDAKLLEAIRWHNGLLAQNNLDPVAREKALIEFTEKYKIKKPRLRLLK